MAKKTDKYDFNQELVEYYKSKVEDMEKAREAMIQYKKARREAGKNSDKAKQIFNNALNNLLYFAYPKIKKSSNIELPDEIASNIDDDFYTVKHLDSEQKKLLLYKIRDMFEALNITSLEREKWETEGIGAVSKEEGGEK